MLYIVSGVVQHVIKDDLIYNLTQERFSNDGRIEPHREVRQIFEVDHGGLGTLYRRMLVDA